MLSIAAIEALVEARHGDPFAVLGPHEGDDGRAELRVFMPDARAVVALEAATGVEIARLERRHPAGFFVGPLGRPLGERVDQVQPEVAEEDLLQERGRLPLGLAGLLGGLPRLLLRNRPDLLLALGHENRRLYPSNDLATPPS